ncbi:MAG TPA: hypothetical protein VMT63_02345 [Bacteroidales bacterium]|nr:hypothetical protein [Bacteroidales bacterium]
MVAVCLSFQHLNGQEKTQEQKEKDEKLRMAIEAQKKAIADQKKAFDLQQLEFDKSLQDANEAVDKTTGTISVIGRSKPRISRDFSSHSYFVTPDANFSGNGFFFNNGGDGERTTWDFSKYVKEATFSKQYSFDVENSAESVVMMVMGDCKEGEIRVKIIMPGGKVYSDILIDESGNLNWRKSFTISDTENKDKAGEWLFKIEATKATGSFKISLQTY